MSKKQPTIHELIDFRAFYPEGEDDGDERKLSCFNPEHDDSHPSMGINLKTGQYNCLACGYKGNAITYARLHLNMSYEDLAKRYGLQKWIDPARVQRYHEALMRNEKVLKYLVEERGIRPEILTAYEIGLDKNRVVIPVKEDGEYVNLRKYLPNAKRGTDKMRNEPGFGTARLWPQSVWQAADPIIVAEGEMDVLALLSQGLSACTGTGGASTWKAVWDPIFAGRRVSVCYDVDETGRKGAEAVCQHLKDYVAELRNVVLPLDPEDFPSGDVTDYFVNQNYDGQDMVNLILATPDLLTGELKASPVPVQSDPKIYDIPSAQIDDQVFDVALGSASKAQYYQRRIRSNVIVSAKDTAPYLIPKELRIRCSMGMKICEVCPVSEAQGDMLCRLRSDDPLLVSLVGRSEDQVKGVVKRWVGIPKQCGAHRMIREDTYNVEEVRLVPQFQEAVDPEDREEYVVRRSYFVGHGIETNAAFAIEGITMPEPQTQHATHLIYEAKNAGDSVVDFSLTPERVKQLRKIASPPKGGVLPTANQIAAALKDRYDDLEANVTHIWGRRAAHLMVDLTYHSVLAIKMAGDVVKGYVESLLLGDSGQGKSAITLALQHHYGIGERVDAGAATVAGLKGGLQETQKRWWVTWGVIPQNDRRLVILEEVKNAHPEVLAKLRDMRSSGIAEVAGIERRRTHARTRLLWVSNPRSRYQLRTYDHGVVAVQELMGNPEDVRRFDLAMCLASGDVDTNLINRRQSEWPEHDRVYTREVCRDLVLWAWSRKSNQIEIASDTRDEVLAAVKRLAKMYHPSVPLVEPADQRLKLLRLACSVAAMTFNTEDGERLLVAPGHVKFVEQYLHQIYNAPAMGYRSYSELRFEDETMADADQVAQAVLGVPHPWDFVSGLLRTDMLSKTDIGNSSGIEERKEVEALVGLLVRKRALAKRGTMWRKQPAFISWLRSLDPQVVKQARTTEVEDLPF